MDLPFVSCLCLTYGRPQVLREAVWCFLQQDYPNKELIILNDHPSPLELNTAHPGVRLHNLERRCSNLGEKRNLAVQLARGELLLVWDDDDLFLPWRISSTVGHLLARPDKWAFKPTSAWTSIDNDQYRIGRNVYHSQLGMWRHAFERVGGYAAINSGEDVDLESRLPKECWLHYPAAPSELIYVYRWGNGVDHISGLGPDRPGRPTAWEILEERYRDVPAGVITPGFDRDYWQELLDQAAHLPEVDPEEWTLLKNRLEPYHDTGGQP